SPIGPSENQKALLKHALRRYGSCYEISSVFLEGSAGGSPGEKYGESWIPAFLLRHARRVTMEDKARE
ncbi:MAG TPA: hypothetical protein PLI09_28470, partial [Candidatus Hydrogenedentes bacterium]|nr:hypothetical protein [Candidatus Hydrogenedentota bacterium]